MEMMVMKYEVFNSQIPRNMMHVMSCKATWGSTSVGQDPEVENLGKNFYCSLHGKE